MTSHTSSFEPFADVPRTALILGATGGFGSEAALALVRHGWRVRAMSRDVARATSWAASRGADWAQVSWIEGDAERAADVVNAADGVQLIVHAVNPPGYRRWRELALPMLANSIDAARHGGARLVLPGNVYNFNPRLTPLIDERSPQQPVSRKGQVRVEMERMLHHASHVGVRSLVLRAGDFIGGHGPSSWLSVTMVKPGKPLRRFVDPSVPGVGHAWAYLPDLAETLARLAGIETSLGDTECFHFAGHWLPQGTELASTVRAVAGQAMLPVHRPPWGAIKLAAPFVPVLAEVLEMRYLWQQALQLDNRKLLATLGKEPHTSLEDVMRASLQGLACLPSDAATPDPVSTVG
jgi:nucleoside-diphosphate-sugar epimerase